MCKIFRFYHLDTIEQNYVFPYPINQIIFPKSLEVLYFNGFFSFNNHELVLCNTSIIIQFIGKKYYLSLNENF